MTQERYSTIQPFAKVFSLLQHIGQRSGRDNTIKQKFKVVHMGKKNPQNKAKKPSLETNKNLNISFFW